MTTPNTPDPIDRRAVLEAIDDWNLGDEKLSRLEARIADLPACSTPLHKIVRVIFDGPPSHESGRFVECEDESGKGIHAGEWKELTNGLWELRIALDALPACPVDSAPEAPQPALDVAAIIEKAREYANDMDEYSRWGSCFTDCANALTTLAAQLAQAEADNELLGQIRDNQHKTINQQRARAEKAEAYMHALEQRMIGSNMEPLLTGNADADLMRFVFHEQEIALSPEVGTIAELTERADAAEKALAEMGGVEFVVCRHCDGAGDEDCKSCEGVGGFSVRRVLLEGRDQ